MGVCVCDGIGGGGCNVRAEQSRTCISKLIKDEPFRFYEIAKNMAKVHLHPLRKSLLTGNAIISHSDSVK